VEPRGSNPWPRLVELMYLPPYSPELNDIGHIWRSAKYEDCPTRAHTNSAGIGTAVDRALTCQRARIRGSAANLTKAVSAGARQPHAQGVTAAPWPGRV
jgi:hypothetical protein